MTKKELEEQIRNLKEEVVMLKNIVNLLGAKTSIVVKPIIIKGVDPDSSQWFTDYHTDTTDNTDNNEGWTGFRFGDDSFNWRN